MVKQQESKAKKAIGRPPATWTAKDIKQFKALCQQQSTIDEVCEVLGVSDKTLNRLIDLHLFEEVTGHKRGKDDAPISFSAAYKRFSAGGKASLRRMQWRSAQDGNIAMQIFLGKNYLGQSDRPDQTEEAPVVVVDDIG